MPPLVRWLKAWKDWLDQPNSRHLSALLTLPESDPLISGNRCQKLRELNEIRDKFPAIETETLLSHQEVKPALKASIASLVSHRRHFLNSTFPEALSQHLAALPVTADISQLAGDFLNEAGALFVKIRRSPLFWLQAFLDWLPTPSASPSTDRVIDVQGWLELLFEPGKHLMICGMNETFIPSRPGGEPWLTENVRCALGLTSEKSRHARDAYLLHAMVMMRREPGSATLICSKTGTGAEPLLPSRLLLRVPRERLVSTVEHLFREMEPPEADLAWSRDWLWNLPDREPRPGFRATSFRDYLACPFRFYLKHVLNMQAPEPDRREMNHRDFGNIAHAVLETWGHDPDARRLTDPEKITAAFHSILDASMLDCFGKNPPLGIRVQEHKLRRRLEWLAEKQAAVASEGWEIIEVEKAFLLDFGHITVTGKIDRIDRHRDTGQIRVFDYKTGKISKVEEAHRKKIVEGKTRIPVHLVDTPAIHGEPGAYLWKNLQLPIYALACQTRDAPLAEPAYIHLGDTANDVGFSVWQSFSHSDLESAKHCAEWVLKRIAEKAFGPPAEKVEYDDFAILSHNAPLAKAFAELA